MPTETQIHLDGITLAARVWGPDHGTPVLALHGWLDSAASFDRLAPLLPDLRLVCLDFAGHGLSEHRHATACYDFIYWIPDVLAAADALGWQRFALIGHSMGAMVAVCVAGTAPERVTHLALVDGLGPLASEPEQAPERLAKAIAVQQRIAARPPTVMPDRADAARRLRQAVAGLDQTSAEILVTRGTREVEGGVTWRHDPRLRGKSLLRLSEDHVRAFLRRVTCPTLVLRPEQGWPADTTLMRARLDCLAHGRLLKVPGGHHAHLTDPGAVAPAIAELLG